MRQMAMRLAAEREDQRLLPGRPWRLRIGGGRDRTYATLGRALIAAERLDERGKLVIGVEFSGKG